MIATAGEDNTVKIWKSPITNNKNIESSWKLVWEQSFDEPVWKCSWSPVGFMLAISLGNNSTSVYK